jgi:hypothetical protein
VGARTKRRLLWRTRLALIGHSRTEIGARIPSPRRTQALDGDLVKSFFAPAINRIESPMSKPDTCGLASGLVAFILVALLSAAEFDDTNAAELSPIPVCSASVPASSAACSVVPAAAGARHRIQLALRAKRAIVPIGPYAVATDALNGTYLPPLLQLAPGEDFELRLANELQDPPVPLQMVEATLDPSNPNYHSHDQTMLLPRSDLNLHTHGLIVSPKNARETWRQHTGVRERRQHFRFGQPGQDLRLRHRSAVRAHLSRWPARRPPGGAFLVPSTHPRARAATDCSRHCRPDRDRVPNRLSAPDDRHRAGLQG